MPNPPESLGLGAAVFGLLCPFDWGYTGTPLPSYPMTYLGAR